MMLIVAIDLDITIRGERSACKEKSISSAYKGKNIVDIPFPLNSFHPFIPYGSICACSVKIVDN